MGGVPVCDFDLEIERVILDHGNISSIFARMRDSGVSSLGVKLKVTHASVQAPEPRHPEFSWTATPFPIGSNAVGMGCLPTPLKSSRPAFYVCVVGSIGSPRNGLLDLLATLTSAGSKVKIERVPVMANFQSELTDFYNAIAGDGETDWRQAVVAKNQDQFVKHVCNVASSAYHQNMPTIADQDPTSVVRVWCRVLYDMGLLSDEKYTELLGHNHYLTQDPRNVPHATIYMVSSPQNGAGANKAKGQSLRTWHCN